MTDKPMEWEILGRIIGTATAWDQADTFVMQLYDFEPAVDINLPSGCLCIDFESGIAEIYDDEGKPLITCDLVAAIAHIPPILRKEEAA